MTIILTKDNIGKSYKTRGGWRAILVNVYNDGSAMVYHIGNIDDTEGHSANGTCAGRNQFDLIEEWKEPRTLDIKISVDFERSIISVYRPHPFTAAIYDYNCDELFGDRIKTVTITEGEE